jgi:hypothetical protein
MALEEEAASVKAANAAAAEDTANIERKRAKRARRTLRNRVRSVTGINVRSREVSAVIDESHAGKQESFENILARGSRRSGVQSAPHEAAFGRGDHADAHRAGHAHGCGAQSERRRGRSRSPRLHDAERVAGIHAAIDARGDEDGCS